jgi:DNA-binding MarR family transcriptional regulator
MDSSAHEQSAGEGRMATQTAVAVPPADPGALADRLLDVLSIATRRIRREMRRNGSLELTVPQFRALRYVQRHPGTDLSRLADHLGVSRSSASALVERLVRADQVTRTTDPLERRRIRIELSETGVDVVGRAVRGTRAWLTDELDEFEPEQRRSLSEALELLARVGATAEAGPQVAR